MQGESILVKLASGMDDDGQTPMQVAQEIIRQVSDSESPFKKGVLTSKVQRVCILHPETPRSMRAAPKIASETPELAPAVERPEPDDVEGNENMVGLVKILEKAENSVVKLEDSLNVISDRCRMRHEKLLSCQKELEARKDIITELQSQKAATEEENRRLEESMSELRHANIEISAGGNLSGEKRTKDQVLILESQLAGLTGYSELQRLQQQLMVELNMLTKAHTNQTSENIRHHPHYHHRFELLVEQQIKLLDIAHSAVETLLHAARDLHAAGDHEGADRLCQYSAQASKHALALEDDHSVASSDDDNESGDIAQSSQVLHGDGQADSQDWVVEMLDILHKAMETQLHFAQTKLVAEGAGAHGLTAEVADKNLELLMTAKQELEEATSQALLCATIFKAQSEAKEANKRADDNAEALKRALEELQLANCTVDVYGTEHEKLSKIMSTVSKTTVEAPGQQEVHVSVCGLCICTFDINVTFVISLAEAGGAENITRPHKSAVESQERTAERAK